MGRQGVIYRSVQGGIGCGVVHLELKAAGSFQISFSFIQYGITSQKIVIFKTFKGLNIQTGLPYI
jgi:hypothetical protein